MKRNGITLNTTILDMKGSAYKRIKIRNGIVPTSPCESDSGCEKQDHCLVYCDDFLTYLHIKKDKKKRS